MVFIEERIERVPESGCWIWLRSTISTGYGCYRKNKKTHLAHRLSYETYKGPIPTGLHILHRCDVPACVNPDHLSAGTNAQNIADSVAKGRRKGITRKRPSGLKYCYTNKKPGPRSRKDRIWGKPIYVEIACA